MNFDVEAWFDGCCEPVNPGGHAAWGAAVKYAGHFVYRDGGYCGFGAKMSNNVAEYMGVTNAIREAAKYPGVILIRGDSKLVVMQLQCKWKVNGGLYHPFYLQARELYDQHKERIKLEWIPRDQNEVCDALSKQVLRDREVKFRIQPDFPPTSKPSAPSSASASGTRKQ